MEANVYLPNISNLSNSEDLAYFMAMQESRQKDTPGRCAQKWDHRAEFWKKEQVNNRKGEARVISAMTYLEQKGLLQNHFDVVDIGCGPAKFVSAFARQVHHVVGLDISRKMVEHGREHIHKEGLTNAQLYTCDFQTLDIEKEGYKGAFDLVFSSMTPAIHNMDSLMKSIEMSRAWCCHITHLSGRNHLREQIMQDVFGRQAQRQWTGSWFYSLFNVLFLLGYDPETSYENRHQEIWVNPDEEYVEFLMEHMLPPEEITKEHADQIRKWLLAHRNEDGLVQEITDSSYGRILWDVRNRTERPDYHIQRQGA
ncbi:MAG: class I SAM-dependent methyltransferase [Aristaeellaceae bacterium]